MKKTIAAISTPRATGGISVIRISGEDAISIADKVFSVVCIIRIRQKIIQNERQNK